MLELGLELGLGLRLGLELGLGLGLELGLGLGYNDQVLRQNRNLTPNNLGSLYPRPPAREPSPNP